MGNGKKSIFDPRAGLWVLIAANIIAFSDHTLWVELALVALLLALMIVHRRFTMAVKWAVGYCALLVFQQVILPASPMIIATSFTIFATYTRRMFPCLMTGSASGEYVTAAALRSGSAEGCISTSAIRSSGKGTSGGYRWQRW